jgi:hypothetical protein
MIAKLTFVTYKNGNATYLKLGSMSFILHNREQFLKKLNFLSSQTKLEI